VTAPPDEAEKERFSVRDWLAAHASLSMAYVVFYVLMSAAFWLAGGDVISASVMLGFATAVMTATTTRRYIGTRRVMSQCAVIIGDQVAARCVGQAATGNVASGIVQPTGYLLPRYGWALAARVSTTGSDEEPVCSFHAFSGVSWVRQPLAWLPTPDVLVTRPRRWLRYKEI
jgi:hypothetical protein